MDLPMVLGGQIILSTPDSGSEENIISKDLVNALGVVFDTCPDQQKEFRMGNSKIVKALGRLTLPCKFAKDQTSLPDCFFYVFNTLITPLIMGMRFLESTETLTKNKHRLQARPELLRGPLLCASINNPKRRLRCYTLPGPSVPWKKAIPWVPWQLDITLANADTGSEINLMSLAFCERRRFALQKLGPGDSTVQFADGSTAFLAGKVNVRVSFGLQSSRHKPLVLYVLKDLTCDVLFGEDFLEDTNAFETYHDSFSIEDNEDLAQVNTIVWFKTPERFLSGLGRRSNTAPEPLSGWSK